MRVSRNPRIALKGQNKTAQGIALGNQGQKQSKSPERATQREPPAGLIVVT